jgi:hypothetical protein
MRQPLRISGGKYLVALGIILVIALAHIFRVGSYFSGRLYQYYYSYFSDIVLPFGVYLLVCLNDTYIPFLRPWWVKALLVFAAAAFAETLQLIGVPVLGVTFDPLDYLMYGAGALAAALVETALLRRFLPFWRTGEEGG